MSHRDKSELLRLKGNELFRQSQFHEAVQLYKAGLDEYPCNIACLVNLGVAFIKLKQFDEAVKPLTEALNLEPQHVKALSNRATAYLQLGQYADALADIDVACIWDRTNKQLLRQRVDIRDAFHEYRIQREAQTKAAQATVVTDRTEEVRLHGNELFRQGKFSEAATLYREALVHDPANLRCATNLGLALLKQQLYIEAEQVFASALVTHPKNAKLLSNRCTALVALHRLEEALADINLACVIEPSNGPLRQQQHDVEHAYNKFKASLPPPMVEQPWHQLMRPTEGGTHILDLPDDCLCVVFDRITAEAPRVLFKLRHVCKVFATLISLRATIIDLRVFRAFPGSFQLPLLQALPNVRKVAVNPFRFENSHLIALVESCRKIRHLNLNGCDALTDDGLCYAVKRLPKLETLNLSTIPITNRTILAIAASCRRLSVLSIAYCVLVSPQAVRELFKLNPKMKVTLPEGNFSTDNDSNSNKWVQAFPDFGGDDESCD